jgi:hypothetical protein
MPVCLLYYWSKIEAILFNIIGGVLTVLAVEGAKYSERKWSRSRFKRIFGAATDPYYLVHANLNLNPDEGAENAFPPC